MTDKAAQGNSSTITLVVTMTFKPDEEQAFLDDAAKFIKWVEVNEPGTLLYTLSKHPSREHTYVWVERYADGAAAEAHRNSLELQAILPLVRERLAGEPEFMRLQQALPK